MLEFNKKGKQWFLPVDNEEYKKFKFNLNIEDDIISRILFNRLDKNVKNPLEYLYPNLEIDFELDKLKDVDKGADLIIKHMNNKSKIALVFDYDADGIDSGVVGYLAMTKVFKYDNIVVIGNTRKTGNGYSEKLMERILKEDGIRLIISSDHGSSNEKEFKILKNHNIEMVITDHHEVPKDNYPHSATVFINNQREDSEYSKNISGCFVLFLTMVAVYKKYINKDLKELDFLLPYVALTTISDVMSMKDIINRNIVRMGLLQMNKFKDLPWRTIRNVLRTSNRIDSRYIGFNIAPIINTGNRVNAEEVVFKFLTSETFEESKDYLDSIMLLNNYRKGIQKDTIKKIKEQINFDIYKNSICVGLDLEISITGIVASSIGELFKLPTVVYNIDNEIVSASVRGILEEINVNDIFNKINNTDKDIFVKFGAHKGAGGCSININKLETFKELFDKYSKELMVEDLDNRIKADLYIKNSDINIGLVRTIDSLGPYGKDWREPIFLTKIKIKSIYVIGSFAKITFINDKGYELHAKHFFKDQLGVINSENIKDHLHYNDTVRIGFKVLIDQYMGTNSFSIDIVSIEKLKDKNESI